MLKNIKTNDKRIKILQNFSPSNYSKGLSTCLKAVKTKYTLITHSDCQVNLDTSIKSWLENLYESRSIISIENHLRKIIMSFRTNRSLTENVMTNINNLLAYKFLNWDKKMDFNSQPKIIETSLIKDFSCENGYLFDLSLVDHINKKIEKSTQIKNVLQKIGVNVRWKFWNSDEFCKICFIRCTKIPFCVYMPTYRRSDGGAEPRP